MVYNGIVYTQENIDENIRHIKLFTKAFESRIKDIKDVDFVTNINVGDKYSDNYCVQYFDEAKTKFVLMDKNRKVLDEIDLSTSVSYDKTDETYKRAYTFNARKWDRNEKLDYYSKREFESFDKLIDNFMVYRLNIYL